MLRSVLDCAGCADVREIVRQDAANELNIFPDQSILPLANQLFATDGDPNNGLADLDGVEEKIREAQKGISLAASKAVTYDARSV